MTPAPLRFSDILSVARDGGTRVAWTPAAGGQPPAYTTLAQLRAHAARCAALFQRRPENRWALCFEDACLMAAAFLAALHTGKAIVLPGNIREAVLAEQSPAFDALVSDFPLRIPGRLCADIRELPEPEPPAAYAGHPAAPATCPGVTFHTSGSTGQPKPVHKTITALQTENDIQCARWGAPLTGANIAGTTSHQHLYGFQFRVLLPLTLGAPFNARLIEYHEQLLAAAPRPIALVTSPAFLKRLDPALPALTSATTRHILSAGGHLAPPEADLCAQTLGRAPLEILGSTEAGAIAWRDDAAERLLWTPLPGVRIFHDATDGRLSLQSPFLPAGETLVTDDAIRPATFDERGGVAKFELLGRLDRILKIEEKRISLPEIEQRLLTLDLVTDAAVVPLPSPSSPPAAAPVPRTRLQLGTVLALNERGQALYARLGHGAFLLELRRRLRGWLEPVALPRRLRVVEVIPVTTQGKRPAALLEPLFSPSTNNPADSPALATAPAPAPAADPAVATQEIDIKIPLTADNLWFRGHFTRRPLLPGVAQLHWVLQHAARAFGTGDRQFHIDTIKFCRPVLPGETLHLHLRWTPARHRLEFTSTIHPGNAPAGNGRLTLRPPASGKPDTDRRP
ncbi:MAG: hypothetical protein LBK99_02110 [Opitutaceae bacterium]|jgi:acyl-coenzyme A synthetase/AMP-(fatty) acid ligase|nr:hypothetical protein [Opitutaceae bacterium]